MTLSNVKSVTHTTTGVSNAVFADDASALIITASSWGVATVEMSGDGVNFVSLENSSGAISLTGKQGYICVWRSILPN